MHLKMVSPISSTFSIVKDFQVLKCNPIEEYLIVNLEVLMKEEEWYELDTFFHPSIKMLMRPGKVYFSSEARRITW